jgi:hypothetical protein
MMASPDTQRVKRYTTGPLPLAAAKTRADRLEALLADHQRSGAADMTVRELCEAFCRVYGSVMFPNHCEAGMAALEAAERVVCDRENPRACRVTGVRVKVYRLEAKQVEVF